MIEITRMRGSDADALAALDRECFKVPWSKKAFLDEVKNELAIYFIARDKGRAIGYAGFWNVSGEGDITNIAVSPAYQRQGIASRLLGEVIDTARELKIELLTLEVRKSNIAAQRLYDKFGFKIIGSRKRYYSDNREDALIMTLMLKQ